MKNISATFFDTTHISESDRLAAESAYVAALTSEVPNISILRLIYADQMAGLNGGVDHFEKCESAWDELDRIGQRAAESAIGFWPGEAAHFEVTFG